MKEIHGFFCLTLLACAMLLSSCQEDEKSPVKPGNVRFAINPRLKTDAAGGRATQDLPEAARLYVTIKNASGEEVYSLHEVTLVALGDYVVSQPLALDAGDYVLTEFIVANEEVSYVAPQEGSPLASWVDDPLPIPFSVHDNNIAALDVQVLSFDEIDTPQDFGYVGFNIEVAPYPYFNLSVFKPEGNTFAFTPVHAYILDGSDTLYNEMLPAGINKIAFVGDMDGIYDLVLIQSGFRKHTQTFVLRYLLEGVVLAGKKAVEVTLQPAFTFVTWGNSGAAFRAYGSSLDELTVDWGDGTIEPVYQESASQAEHEYDGTQAHYFVSVWGNDLNNIDELSFAYDFGSLNEIALQHLPALETFRLGFAQAPPLIDFSHNPNINNIQLIVSLARAIKLAEDASIQQILLMGNGHSFLSNSLDHIIEVSYQAAVSGRQPFATLGLVTMYEPGPPRLIATPSPGALEKLRALRDIYGWNISPDDF
jgi:hypothetical protein